MYDALKSRKIFAAGLDVLAEEDFCSSMLGQLHNCILTPHIGATTLEAIDNMGYLAAQNVLEVLSIGDCKNRVN